MKKGLGKMSGPLRYMMTTELDRVDDEHLEKFYDPEDAKIAFGL